MSSSKISHDPERRRKQVANLRSAPPRRRATCGAVPHGARSRVLLAPLREQAEVWARDRWPWLDDTRRHLVADLAARIDRVRVWEDENDIIDRRGKHTIRSHPIVDSCDRWEARLWALTRELDAEARERQRVDPFTALEAHVAATYAGAIDGEASS